MLECQRNAAACVSAQERRRLVCAEIQCPNRDHVPGEDGDGLGERLEVLLFGRPVRRVEERELRPHEPEPFGGGVARGSGLCRRARVREQADLATVGRDGGPPASGGKPFTFLRVARGCSTESHQRVGARTGDDGAGRAVDDHFFAGGEVEQRLTDVCHHRHAERPSDDRRM